MYTTTNFYASFREWLDNNFPVLDEEVWSRILDEDKDIDYSIMGSGQWVEREEVIQSEVMENNTDNEDRGD